MSGVEPPAPGQGVSPSADSSMEDILASIRKILDDDADPARPPQPLQLTAEMMVAPPEPIVQPAPMPAPAEPVVEPAPPPPLAVAPSPDVALVAPIAAAAAMAAMNQLSLAVAKDRAPASSGLTIEDMVREEIRPMLKAWLDANLPSLTERLVRAEIDRVISRQG